MPIYEYQCKACGHTLDALQSMSEDPLTYCPDCGEPELRKLMSAPRFRLKGDGWYETDFKTGNRRNLHGSDSASGSGKSDGGGKSEKKTDTKSDKSSKPASSSDGASKSA